MINTSHFCSLLFCKQFNFSPSAWTSSLISSTEQTGISSSSLVKMAERLKRCDMCEFECVKFSKVKCPHRMQLGVDEEKTARQWQRDKNTNKENDWTSAPFLTFTLSSTCCTLSTKSDHRRSLKSLSSKKCRMPHCNFSVVVKAVAETSATYSQWFHSLSQRCFCVRALLNYQKGMYTNADTGALTVTATYRVEVRWDQGERKTLSPRQKYVGENTLHKFFIKPCEAVVSTQTKKKKSPEVSEHRSLESSPFWNSAAGKMSRRTINKMLILTNPRVFWVLFTLNSFVIDDYVFNQA